MGGMSSLQVTSDPVDLFTKGGTSQKSGRPKSGRWFTLGVSIC